MSSKGKKTGNLVALGSAAVVAVYGAGFMRTAAAAERFAEQSDERVLSPEDAAATQSERTSQSSAVAEGGTGVSTTSPGSAVAAPTSTTVASDAGTTDKGKAGAASRPAPGLARSPSSALSVTNASRGATTSAATAPVNKADATIAKVSAKPAAVATAGSSVVSTPVPPEVTTVISSAGAAVSSGGGQPSTVTPPSATGSAANSKVVPEKPASVLPGASAAAPQTSAIVPAPAAPTPVAAAPSAPVAAPATSAPVTTAPAVVEPVAAAPSAPNKLKDGEYTGYGTSRHGDVEVYLETTDGRITYVKISQCLTQYSCSWIADLPKQVLARQSARVDGVSGATQSANAFYYAVVQALAKAK